MIFLGFLDAKHYNFTLVTRLLKRPLFWIKDPGPSIDNVSCHILRRDNVIKKNGAL